MFAILLVLAAGASDSTDRAQEVMSPVTVVRDTAWFQSRDSKVSMVVETKPGEFIAKDWKTVATKKPDDVLLPGGMIEIH